MINKKIPQLFILIVFISLTPMLYVKALNCTSSDNSKLRKQAYRIKVDYEVNDYSKVEKLKIGSKETTYKIPLYQFKISLYNFNNDDFGIEIKNSSGTYYQYLLNSMTNDGEFSFVDNNFNSIDTYTFEMFSNIPQCAGESVKVIKLVKPMYNAYSEYDYCKQNSSKYCQKFIEMDYNISNENDFFKKINVSNEESNNQKEKEISLKKNLLNNKRLLIITICTTFIISVVLIIVLFIKPWRKQL